VQALTPLEIWWSPRRSRDATKWRKTMDRICGGRYQWKPQQCYSAVMNQGSKMLVMQFKKKKDIKLSLKRDKIKLLSS